MSKLVVYILDKFVWLLLATVFTGQALQLAGIMETPKAAGAIEYYQQLEDSKTAATRWKREETSEITERSQLIDMLFNIPIKTLMAMNNLVQKSRPAFRKLRDFTLKRIEQIEKSTKVPKTNIVQKRSYPVYIREVEKLSSS
ncbi:uncharacterized protein [Euwallacea fornicatus]|uniref:uncharacterized protein n=1 Tax=Euwallacea fornicatus TaxID=995702 RepID=UPI00338EEE1A